MSRLAPLDCELTQEHIDNGVRLSCSCCPISLAVADKGYVHVSVSGSGVVRAIQQGGSSLAPQRFRLPHEVMALIRLFDDGLPISPSSFRLEPMH